MGDRLQGIDYFAPSMFPSQKRIDGALNEHLMITLGKILYRQKIGQAIEDIPNLTKAIRDKFHEK